MIRATRNPFPLNGKFKTGSQLRSSALRARSLGSLLLIDALRRAEDPSGQVGIRAVEVDAVDEAARNFYLKFGFAPLLDNPHHLFLPMHVIRKLGLPPLTP